MEVVAQLVRAPDCGSGGRGFEPRLPPIKVKEVSDLIRHLFCLNSKFGYDPKFIHPFKEYRYSRIV